MLKSSLRCFLFTLVLCLGWANARAQELEMVAPPIPSVIPTPPPDPDTLPAPPQLQWESLTPKGAEDQGVLVEAAPVAAVEAEAPMAPPPPPLTEPVGGLPDPAAVELVKPDVEIWRQESESPQVPTRRSNRLDPAFITGTAPVTLRVQFSPAAAGKKVYVRPGEGLRIGANDGVLTVSPAGDCLIAAQLAEDISRSHINFYCEGVKTILPVSRASLATVVEAEERGGQ